MAGSDDTGAVCSDCGAAPLHWRSWSEAFTAPLVSAAARVIPDSWERRIGDSLESLFLYSGLTRLKPVLRGSVPARAWYFSEAATKRGIRVELLDLGARYGNRFRMQVEDRAYFFEGLPAAEHRSSVSRWRLDDKFRVKEKLTEAGIPVIEGRAFSVISQKAAFRYGLSLGFPLVVKPRGGSYSRHVVTGVRSEQALAEAIARVIRFSPDFLVERDWSGIPVWRATVVDFEVAGCLKRLPPFVTGDGVHSVGELIQRKNQDPTRGLPEDEEFVLFKIADTEAVDEYLASHGFTRSSIPAAGVAVQVHKDPFIRLGAESEEMLRELHPRNQMLFSRIARLFDARLVGIDVLAEDLREPWARQKFAVLELNSVPCIEVHHEPAKGEPSDAAGKLADMVLKYY